MSNEVAICLATLHLKSFVKSIITAINKYLIKIGILYLSSMQCIPGQSPVLDSRCYLEGGGSAESFLASEDMLVGSIIGKEKPAKNSVF